MKRNVLVLAATIIGFGILGVFGCKSDSTNPYGTSAPPPTNVPANTVVMRSGSFSPASMTVSRGTTVTWRNDDGAIHTSTSDSTGWDTGDTQPGASKTITFATPGTYRYHCTYHRAMGMVGTIIVQ